MTQRLAEIKPLTDSAALYTKVGKLVASLHAFSNYLESQTGSHGDNGFNDGRIGWIGVDIANKRVIEFNNING